MSQSLFNLLVQERKPNKTTMLSFRASPELIAKLEEISERIHQPKSKVIKLILEQGIDELEKDLNKRGYPENIRQFVDA